MSLILTVISFLIYVCYGSIPSVDLVDLENPTEVAFYDYDKSLAINSFGYEILKVCRELTPPCDEVGDMTNALYSLPDPESAVIMAFGNETRIERLQQHFDRLLSDDSSIQTPNIYVLSTSWEPVPKEEWKNLIFATLEMISFDQYFIEDNILTLDDPGQDIPADKGAVLQMELDTLGINDASKCIFVDDSTGNIESANGICDTLYVVTRDGLDFTDLNYIEARALLVPTENYEVSNGRSDSSESGTYGMQKKKSKKDDSGDNVELVEQDMDENGGDIVDIEVKDKSVHMSLVHTLKSINVIWIVFGSVITFILCVFGVVGCMRLKDRTKICFTVTESELMDSDSMSDLEIDTCHLEDI